MASSPNTSTGPTSAGGDDDRAGTGRGAHGTRGAARDAVDAQHDRFGGIKWGSAFFGWLCAIGVAVLLLAAVSAAGLTVGVNEGLPSADEATANADTFGIVGAIIALVLLFIAYLAGGYVAGRMARFDGVRQGVAVWIVGIVILVLIAITVAVAGSQYDVLGQLNLPTIPADTSTLTIGGIIALVAVLLVTLIAAILGGILGTRFHRKVDRAGFDA